MLLVEGGRFLHTFLGGSLEQEGLHVLYARDMGDAANLAAEHGAQLDGFVVDVSRTPREALALATKLHDAHPRKPLVLLSRAEESQEVLARAQALGARRSWRSVTWARTSCSAASWGDCFRATPRCAPRSACPSSRWWSSPRPTGRRCRASAMTRGRARSSCAP
ncbi:hypothetical protein QEG98_39325 [Myxococcus sp. MxC21-1]|uniref:hypothetical protein n=1 Tax=Myxococcus sp. MxC21-1 TaxID=3041439 RepID=UPI002930FFA1|nr:hypothetical protein [Myxococcus sp. MxC21-1]WNZ66167.1 hypothetical protein QEG98_39325 [Myxococcus sp. MxC21-1]